MAPQPPAPVAQSRPWPAASPPALLIAIIDLHPLAWSLLSSLAPGPEPVHTHADKEKEKAPISPISLEEFVTILMVFLNAHLASRWGNEVVVYGATAGKA
jgi:transcription initiation factor TFIIH subunit 3